MLIFLRKRKQQVFEMGSPPGGCAEVNDSRWMTVEVYRKRFKKFIELSNAKKKPLSSYFLMKPLSLYCEDEERK